MRRNLLAVTKPELDPSLVVFDRPQSFSVSSSRPTFSFEFDLEICILLDDRLISPVRWAFTLAREDAGRERVPAVRERPLAGLRVGTRELRFRHGK